MKNLVLIGTILSRSEFPRKPLRDIVDILDVDKIFVFKIENKPQYLLTYNVDKNKIGVKLEELRKRYRNTIRLHRKRSNNVLYTINALNKMEETAKVDWTTMSNCLILLGKEEGVSVMNISLEKVINLKEK